MKYWNDHSIFTAQAHSALYPLTDITNCAFTVSDEADSSKINIFLRVSKEKCPCLDVGNY